MQAITQMIRKDMVPALGVTEPGTIAFAVASAKTLVSGALRHITVSMIGGLLIRSVAADHKMPCFTAQADWFMLRNLDAFFSCHRVKGLRAAGYRINHRGTAEHGTDGEGNGSVAGGVIPDLSYFAGIRIKLIGNAVSRQCDAHAAQSLFPALVLLSLGIAHHCGVFRESVIVQVIVSGAVCRCFLQAPFVGFCRIKM